MKKKQIISLILALVITSLFLTMTSFAEARSQGGFTAKCGAPCGCLNQEGYPAGRSSGYPDWENKRWGIMNLDLSQEQIAEINQIKLEFQKTSLELKKEIGIKKLEVKELMMEDPVDLEKVKAKWEEIAQLQVELKIKSLENQQKIKEVLTPEQLAKCPMRFPRFRFR